MAMGDCCWEGLGWDRDRSRWSSRRSYHRWLWGHYSWRDAATGGTTGGVGADRREVSLDNREE